MDIEVVCGDVFDVKSDLLLLKYAALGGGVHRQATRLLTEKKFCAPSDLRPAPGQAVFIDTPLKSGPASMMLLGIGELYAFGYAEMKRFAERSIELIASSKPAVSHVTTTIHGVGYGLDAAEAIQHLVLGFAYGIRKHVSPSMSRLSRITIVDRDAGRVRVMSTALAALALIESKGVFSGEVKPPGATALLDRLIGASGTPSPPEREHVFAAIPFSVDFEDVYEFGVYEPVRRCGYICERVDQISFTGDILEWIRKRIENAKFVIADLSEGRANVYLEVGYAWGRGVPVIFLAREGEHVHFDVQRHRTIYYKTIKQLAHDLEKLIRGLYGSGERSST